MSDTSARNSVTIRDLAKACGFSPATVSRVLSNSNYPVRQQVREKILKTAKEMNYTIPREPYAPKSSEVAILVPTVTNPFYASLVEGFESSIVRENMSVVVYDTSTGLDRRGSFGDDGRRLSIFCSVCSEERGNEYDTRMV